MAAEVNHAQANVVDLYPVTKGKRVLYIANRADGVLQQELSRALQAHHFKFAVATHDSPNRLRNMEASIASGTFDVVLLVEGFMSHATYNKIVGACSSASKPTALVLVGKGRVSEVQRALADVKLPTRLPGIPLRQTKSRWTGAELARLEDLARDRRTDVEIALVLKNEFDVVRSLQSIMQARINYFGIGIKRGKKDKAPTQRLPQDYLDLRQAQRILSEVAPPPAPVPDEIAMPVPAPVPEVAMPDPVPSQIARRTSPGMIAASKDVLVSITGKKGTLLVESKRPLHEIVAFLMGET